ncbi:MAG: hypothetical protein HY678_09340, partial [Chloroflexi bacterium]|nr:hypothetical protein [Chloroflexota bacterium]
GLIPPNADLAALYRDLLGSQVLGLYDPESEEFLVLGEEGALSALAESTYVHEFTHRLQDIHFDLDALSDAAGDNSDRQLALSALIEGDAVVTQVGYGLRHMDQKRLAEMLALQGEFVPPPADTPRILLESIQFPYETGPQFVAALRAKGGFARVNEAFKDPPMTSEQVMHATKYAEREPAIEVTLDDLSAVLGNDWSLFASDVMGEFFLRAWLQSMGVFTATRAARGWGGDAYGLFDGPDGQSAMVARIVWDDPEADAQEFFEGLVSGVDRSDLKRASSPGSSARMIWNGKQRAFGVELLGGDRGVTIAAAATEQQVSALLDRLAKP